MRTATGAMAPKFSEQRDMRKPGLSLQRHTEVYTDLGRTCDGLQSLSVEIGNAYTRGDTRARRIERKLEKAGGALSEARMYLETLVMIDFPNDDLSGLDAATPGPTTGATNDRRPRHHD